jgi:hypothetical protein
MANNPVQIVLNESDYVVAPEPGKGGPPHDFFAGKDEDFIKHKAKLAGSIQRIAAQLAGGPAGGAGYVRVKLRERALAKTHRPVRALLTPDLFPCVGASGVGELYYFAETSRLTELIDRISEAEGQTRWVENAQGKLEARPSPIRSDVGAIDDITIPDPSGKRRFDAQTAVSWLSDPRTGGFYLVELFENPLKVRARLGHADTNLAKSLEALLTELGAGVVAWRLPEAGGETPIALKLTDRSEPALLMSGRPPDTTLSRIDQSAIRHEKALQRLAQHPSVRRISLPLRVELSDVPVTPSDTTAALPVPSLESRYPRVGIVDSGVGSSLAHWTIARHDFLAPEDVDSEHGSFVAGLIVSASSFNPDLPGLEPDGCQLVDLALFPRGDFLHTYSNGFADFLEEMDQAIGEASQQHGVRVINLSINAVTAVEPDHYSYYAARLDQIAAKHDVIIVNSAGNLAPGAFRAPWPKRPSDAVKYFAARVDPDTIFVPTESCRAISVGAINPPGCSVHHGGVPTTYTRRGPGLKVGCKPDVAHFGGNDGSAADGNHRLTSLSPEGGLMTSCGTSFATPLVAKSLASLENAIEGRLPTHTLRALLIHSCATPELLTGRGLSALARQFVGFGVPSSTTEMLVTDDSSITLVFHSRIPNDVKRPKVLRFDFDWPQSLVDPMTGACRGEATATLVYEPPIDSAYGAEFVRVNLDAKLQQRQLHDRKDGLPSFRDRFEQAFLPKTANQPVPEKELINQGLKWWPTKRYRTRIPATGIGESSRWRIEVSAVKRAEATFPNEGVPFSLVVTIRDPDEVSPVFQQLRRALQAGKVQLEELRTHQRVRASRA